MGFNIYEFEVLTFRCKLNRECRGYYCMKNAILHNRMEKSTIPTIARMVLLFAMLVSFTNINASETDSEATDSISGTSMIASGRMPVEMTAHDLVTKVYGVIDANVSRESLTEESGRMLNLMPEEDEFGLWLEHDCGYSISYYGLTPDVTAMAEFDNDSVKDFAFFFLFPYTDDDKESVNKRQAEFCGCLLQEMHDLGIDMGLNETAEALFELAGTYAGNFVEVRLIDELQSTGAGRYVVYLKVEPDAVSSADCMAAI